MGGAQRKYGTEFLVNALCVQTVLLQQDALPYATEESGVGPCHIYIVSRRPRITLDLPSIEFNNTYFSGTCIVATRTERVRVPFIVPHGIESPPEEAQFESPYPYANCQLVTMDGNILFAAQAWQLLAATAGFDRPEYIDLEVLYVGQSYGVDGARRAPDRLVHHKTLQGIYAEALTRSPEMDIWLTLHAFEQVTIAHMQPPSAEPAVVSDEEDHAHAVMMLTTPLSKQQLINFAEAGLIAYFRPAYNKIFKDSFPNPAHKTYAECYTLDANAVLVELQTEHLGWRFYSHAVEPLWTHFGFFPLHDESMRRHFLDFELGDDGTTDVAPTA